MREVTERDFRMPEFRDAKVEDYELRDDGKVVRKDRWETAIRSIRYLVGISCREFEIPDVVEAVRKLAASAGGWQDVADDTEPDDLPDASLTLEVRLTDGSILRNVRYVPNDRRWLWNGADADALHLVEAWREQRVPSPPEA